MDETDPEVKAKLVVWGRFEPLEVSELLGVEGSVRRHTDLRRDGMPWTRQQDAWAFKTQPELTVDWPAHIEQVLSLVRPVKAEFRKYCQRYELEGEIGLVATMSGFAPIGTLSRSAIQEIAELGFGVDIDLYIASSDQHRGASGQSAG